MDTAHLKAFLKIAETGSISRAAESLGIAQPTLSQQLLRLEDEVGISLFDRTARGVTLTEGGRVFQERARQILHAADEAVADARHLRQEARGQVVFAMPPSMARLIGAPLVQALAEQAPLVRVRVVEAYSGSIRGWIEEEKIDLGMTYDLGPLRHLVVRPLASDELVVVAAKGQFDTGQGPPTLSMADLAGKPLIAPGPQHGLRQLLEREASRSGVVLTITQEIDSLDAMIELAVRGLGLAIVPHCAVMASIGSGRLSTAGMAAGGLWRRLSLLRNPAHVLTHASVRVETQARSVLARLIAEGAWAGRLESE